ncbi:glycosyltransferase [Microvirga sp. VF16]|uniref:glycosyltransferase n=1 Tax=Microvirga sp. VF16 TaxID=2807101 RepID=UPI00193EBA3C|nr:glycosyltransferase [Microvirga sp. VF16]QRM35611.1 glycosyltransferase [Microvirga sp. VF16]
MSDLRHVSWFTPLPPARNGIADYSYMLLDTFKEHMPSTVYCNDPFGQAPPSIEVREAVQAFRYISSDTPILHQIGNNGGHVFVLEALRHFSGVVSLHDLSLLYLYELASSHPEEIYSWMEKQSPAIGSIYARHWKDHKIKTRANYTLFDMTGEVLATARAVIVHSRFAKNKLRLIYGDEATQGVTVIPHFAPKLRDRDLEEARARLNLDKDDFILLTSGFATEAKRFNWLIEALDEVAARGIKVRWIHAGEERPSEYALSAEIARYPRVKEFATITGYVSEEDLDRFIVASDVVVNLRYPSVGENSGTLARAFSAGKCCIVNDTAAYAELPRDAVVHIPIDDPIVPLAEAIAGLADKPDVRLFFAQNALSYAKSELSLESVANAYLSVMSDAYALSRPVLRMQPPQSESVAVERDIEFPKEQGELVRRVSQIISGTKGKVRLRIWFSSPENFASASVQFSPMLDGLFPLSVKITGSRLIQKFASGNVKSNRIGIEVEGIVH